MTTPQNLSAFDLARNELKRLGVKLDRLPGEYCINYFSGGEKTARHLENLEDAVSEGRRMASQLVAQEKSVSWCIMPLTMKAKRRFKILAHNHKARAIWLKKRHKTG